MNAKNAGLVGLGVVGILVTLVGLYFGFLAFSSPSVLLVLGTLITLAVGITMTVIGFTAE